MKLRDAFRLTQALARRRHDLRVLAEVTAGAEPHPLLVALPLASLLVVVDDLGVTFDAEPDDAWKHGVRLRPRFASADCLARDPVVSAAIVARADELVALHAWRLLRPAFDGAHFTD